MPDRLIPMLERLDAAVANLTDQVTSFRRNQRWKNLLGAVLLVGVLCLALWNWRARVDENYSRCVALNTSRVAIRQADASRGDALVALVESFDAHPSAAGRRFIAQLEAQNKATKANLVRKLPIMDC